MEVVEVATRRARGMPSERAVTIYLNDVEVATTQATPHDLEELAVGFLVAEGLLADREAFTSVDVDTKRGFVWVTSDRGGARGPGLPHALPHERLRQGRHLLQRRPRARTRARSPATSP